MIREGHMRTRFYSILSLIAAIVYLAAPAASQDYSPYHPSVDAERCSALRIELANTERKLLQIDPQYKRGQTLQALTDTLNGSIAALEGMKGDADKVKGELEKITKYLKGQHEGFEDAVKQALEASGALADKSEAVVNHLKQASKFLDIALAAERAPTAADMAKAFDDYYQAIKEPLGPYLKAIPVIGGFIDAYGEAVHSAAASIADIESIRRKQGDLMREIAGKDYYHIPTKKEQEWNALTQRAAAIKAELAGLDCDKGAPEPEDTEGPDIPQEIIDSCQKKAGLPDTYMDELRALYRKIAIARSNLTIQKNNLDRSNRRIKDAQFSLSYKKSRLEKAKNGMKGNYDFIQKMLAAMKSNPRYQNIPLPQANPTRQESTIYEVQYLPMLKGTSVYDYIKEHLKSAKTVRDLDADAQRSDKNLEALKQEQASLNADIERRSADLKKLQASEAEYDRKIQVMTDCIEKQSSSDADAGKLPKCKKYSSILGALERVSDEIEGKCSGDQ